MCPEAPTQCVNKVNIVISQTYLHSPIHNMYYMYYKNMYLQQAILVNLHFLEGTHRLEEPVSKTTLKSCGGVPIVIGP